MILTQTIYLSIADRESRNQMKITRHKVILILLISTLTFGCSYTKAIRQEEAKNKHNIIIVPFKASPIKIQPDMRVAAIPGCISPILAPVGPMIAYETTKEERGKIAETLNKIHGQWNPSDIIARECFNLIKGSTILKTENVILVDVREFPFAEAWRLEQPQVCTAEGGRVETRWWYAADSWWKKDKSTIQYKEDYPQSNADWALEVGSSHIQIVDKELLRFNVFLKLFNTRSGEKIASIVAREDSFPISLAKSLDNFKAFEEQFSIATKKYAVRP